MESKNIYSKLQEVSLKLQQSEVKKSGYNQFSKFYYYELKDFMPVINEELAKKGIWHKVDFETVGEVLKATLTFIDDNGNEAKVIHDIPRTMTMKGANEMQVTGSIQTYARRYLYLSAFGITDGDVIDSQDKAVFKEDNKNELIAMTTLLQKLKPGKRKEVVEWLATEKGIDTTDEQLTKEEIAFVVIVVNKTLKKIEETEQQKPKSLFEGE